MFNPSSPVTGATQTGFTSPTYTFVSESAPDVNGKQFVVTAVGGTQTGVTVSTVSAPNRFTWWRPRSFKAASGYNPTSQRYDKVPMNVHKLVTAKAASVSAAQYVTNMATTTFEVGAGSETYDAPNVRALVCEHIGVLNANSAGIGDTLTSGVS